MRSENPDSGNQQAWKGLLASAHRLDASLYAVVAASSTPSLDRSIGIVSNAANMSKPWIATSAAMALLGGKRGRRAALFGLASLTVASTVVNVAIKPLSRRRRPDRAAAGVIKARHVSMPSSTAFPSGHSASAFAFALGVGHVIPAAGAALALPASLVAYSRVHSGVHYPGDVIVGSLSGALLAKATCRALERAGR